MNDAAQWVRGLVGRRAGAAGAGRQRSRAGARLVPDKPSADVSHDDRSTDGSGWRASWRVAPVLAASLAMLGILALYWPTLASIVAIWIRSETFTHGFVVVPICLWLVWRHRETIAAVPALPWWPGLAIVFVAGALWFVTSVADVLGVKQFALAFMLQAAIVTVLGTRIARAAFFPLAFLLFAVPFGEIFVPTLIDWTADFTVAALRFSGVPVYREANFFIIPSGAWSVVAACSGVRYLIASVMIGTIYAAVAYRSTRRRVMFMAAAILVPIVANWLRAYMIVMIGHLSNNKLAVGVDHIIYGWVFFGLVMLLLFWIGSLWQEDAAPAPAASPRPTTAPAVAAPPRVLFTAAVAAMVAAGVWVPLEARIDRSDQPSKPSISAVAAENGWGDSPLALTDWKPRYRGYAAELQQTLTKDGHQVGLYVAYYRQQSKGSELITSGNQLVAPEDWKWKQVGKGSDSIEWSGRPERVERADLSGQTAALQAYRLYWVAGNVTSSQYVAKALQAWSKLSGRGDDAALVVIYAPRRTRDDDPTSILRAFTREMSASIERALAATRERRG
jgi:exosortase A